MEGSPFTRLHVENFTAFEKLDLDLAGGLNVFIGENATGKTHLLKIIYALVEVASHIPARILLDQMFANIGGSDELLRHGRRGQRNAEVSLRGPVQSNQVEVKIYFSDYPDPNGSWGHASKNAIPKDKFVVTFIPVKEWLAHATGFLSLYDRREISFESIYRDILLRAGLPPLKGDLDAVRRKLVQVLEKEIGGPVEQEGERYYQVIENGRLDFALVAEGLRKLALLWLLLRNGSLEPDSTLLWDEPEANLNPRLVKLVVEVLLTLARAGVQIFIATHSYFVLKEIDLQTRPGDAIAFHVLTRSGGHAAGVQGRTFGALVDIEPNVISDVFADMQERDLDKKFGTKRA